MNCQKVEILIIDYIDQNLDEKIREEVSKHIAQCEFCMKEYKETRELFIFLNKIKDEEPPVDMRDDFLAMLEQEKKEIRSAKKRNLMPQKKQTTAFNQRNFLLKIAAAIIILITGLSAGYLFNMINSNKNIEGLRAEISEMKQIMLLSQQNGNPVARMQAVNYLEKEVENNDPEIIRALKNTALKDDNTNVRQAAYVALGKIGNEEIKLFLIEQLPFESDPLIQITLIDVLTKLNEKRAVKSFDKLLYDVNTTDVVKLQAKRGKEILI